MRFNLKQHKWIVELVICLTVTSLIAILYLFNIGEPFELKTIDLRFKLRGVREANRNVAIISMDEFSISQIGKWPWRRYWHGHMVNVLSKYKPAAICFDVIFTEPDKNFPNDDAYFAKESKESNKVYFPYFFPDPKIEPYNKRDYEILKEKATTSKKILERTIEFNPEGAGKYFRASEIKYPIPELLDALKGAGYVNALPDVDGVTRRVPLVIEHRGRLYRSFAFEVACDYIKADVKDIEVKFGKHIEIKKSHLGAFKIPIDEKGQMLVNYDGGNKTFKEYSYVDPLVADRNIREKKEAKIDLEDFRNKILFIGLTATGTVDIRPTPFTPLYALVGVLANTTSNILDKRFLRETGKLIDILTLFALGIIIGLALHRMQPLFGAAFSILMVAVYFGIAYYLFAFAGICVKVIYPCGVIIFGYLTIIVFKFATEEREKKWIKNVFQRYVSSSVVDEMLSDVDKLSLGGTKKVLTIFFADIRGFTTMSESMKPEDVVAVLNRVFTMITEILFKYEGTLDKFMGDCVMAIWGAPIALRNPEELALRTAIEMQEGMKAIQEDLVREGRHPCGFGVGINTGEVIVGNMGSLQHMDYTVIGDEVNLTSRIEGCAKSGQILITESVYEKTKDIIKTNKLDPVKVKGKAHPIPVYEVLGIN